MATFVSTFTTVTFAPATTAPVESVTVPRMVPLPTWACGEGAAEKRDKDDQLGYRHGPSLFDSRNEISLPYLIPDVKCAISDDSADRGLRYNLDEGGSVKRRDLLSSLGSYSLAVFAGGAAEGQTQDRFERIAPHASGTLPSPEPHMRLVDLDTDILVAGGGLAGVCAAISAARHGARVVLVQDRSRLGGNSSSEVKMHVVGANSHKARPGWRDSGLIEEFKLDDAVNNPQRSFEMWDLLLYDKVMSEPNITLLLETAVYAAEVTNDTVQR